MSSYYSGGSKTLEWRATSPLLLKCGPLKQKLGLPFLVTNNANVYFDFSNGHSAKQLLCLCGKFQNDGFQILEWGGGGPNEPLTFKNAGP